jgi:excisionase family DNA binding protein
MRSYKMLDGTRLSSRNLTGIESQFLKTLEAMIRARASYFDVYRFALGPGSPALRGGNRVDQDLAETDLYRIAEDLITRAGINQGIILAPEHEAKRALAKNIESPLSVAQAAAVIGISRIAAYKAIQEGRLGHTKIGNVLIVSRAQAELYKANREGKAGPLRSRPRASTP